MHEWHRHDGFLKAVSLNIKAGVVRGLFPWNADDPLNFLEKCIEPLRSERVWLHGQGAQQCFCLKREWYK